MGGGVKENNATVAPSAPSVFQPPLPPLRHGNHNQHEQSISHYKNRSDTSFKSSFHQSLTENIKGENRSQDGYRLSHSSRQMRTLSSDTPGTQAYQKKASFLSSGKNGSFNPYHRQDDTRHPPEASRVIERGNGGDISGKRGGSQGVNEDHYPYSRDGPSPGRGFGRPDDFHQPSEESFPPSQHVNMQNMFVSSHGKKRKSPNLISKQSSDDSINGLLPKRARAGTSLSAESTSLMKSFTPLSPMHSRSFSRDEAMDMSRFTMRSSNEGHRIFHSWSSGNSNSGSQSPSDVRICYDDWQSGDRRGSVPSSNRSWEEKGPSREDTSNKGRDSGTNIHYQNSSKVPSSYSKSSRIAGSIQQRWPSPHPQERHQNPRRIRYETQGHDKNMLLPTSARNQCQILHSEDRCPPYHNQLSHHINPAAQYGRVMDVGRTFWRGQPVPPHIQYGSQRRDDIEERTKMLRGRPSSPTSRLSAPTPPVTNGYGRFSNDFHHPNLYEMHMARGPRPSFEPWMNRNRLFGAAPYSNGSGQSHESRESSDGYNRPYQSRCSHLLSVKIESGPNGSSAMRTADNVLLLSLPEDRISLSETLCIVRENVEVFIATEADVKAPAPGRKRPVVEGQVGLRCIHCRAALHQSDKVKRAVCFPSSIKRIYRTVIDMKLDHFKACRFVPIELKMKLEELKATNARSTGTTMQYFVQAAKRMGMQDGTHGIRFVEKDKDGNVVTGNSPSPDKASSNSSNNKSNDASDNQTKTIKSDGTQSAVQSVGSFALSLDLSISGDSNGSGRKKDGGKKKVEYHTGKAILALPEDKTALSPLRCFLRKNVYAFSATAEDIAVRTPTTFSVVLGQVGIGCIHCLGMPAKERSNRAVCFPFSIGRIYQSVADIQRFHIGECKMVPETVRAKFLELQSASSKGSKGLATRQYWVTSAKKLGLVDSDSGIRFNRDPTIPLEKAVSLDILAQVASDVTTAAKPLVLPEDKPHIAGFLFHVMKQLQPCRFTEADRNKRRLKDVGCIGVECRHCAGQVDGRKFFWSSVSAVESNFVSVHTHMMECRMIPKEMKTKLAHLKTLRKEQTSRLKSGSQKAFFSRVWKRLHTEGDKVPSIKGQAAPPKIVDSQPVKIESAINTSTPRTCAKVPPTTVAVPLSSKENISMDVANGTSPVEEISTAASLNLEAYSPSAVSSPNSSLTTSPDTLPSPTVEQPNPKQDIELLTCGTHTDAKVSSVFISSASIESAKSTATKDIKINANPVSLSASMESTQIVKAKEETIDATIFNTSASISPKLSPALAQNDVEPDCNGESIPHTMDIDLEDVGKTILVTGGKADNGVAPEAIGIESEKSKRSIYQQTTNINDGEVKCSISQVIGMNDRVVECDGATAVIMTGEGVQNNSMSAPQAMDLNNEEVKVERDLASQAIDMKRKQANTGSVLVPQVIDMDKGKTINNVSVSGDIVDINIGKVKSNTLNIKDIDMDVMDNEETKNEGLLLQGIVDNGETKNSALTLKDIDMDVRSC